jgi:hypothetical protein
MKAFAAFTIKNNLYFAFFTWFDWGLGPIRHGTSATCFCICYHQITCAGIGKFIGVLHFLTFHYFSKLMQFLVKFDFSTCLRHWVSSCFRS